MSDALLKTTEIRLIFGYGIRCCVFVDGYGPKVPPGKKGCHYKDFPSGTPLAEIVELGSLYESWSWPLLNSDTPTLDM